LANFYNTDVLAPERIGEAALRASFQVAAGASPHASYVCVDTWLTDFRGDLPEIDVPKLVVHGTADRILPFEATAARLRDERLIADLTVAEIADGPHNIGWTIPRRPTPRCSSSSAAKRSRHRADRNRAVVGNLRLVELSVSTD
jgi:non-heme chloroperoxidase